MIAESVSSLTDFNSSLAPQADSVTEPGLRANWGKRLPGVLVVDDEEAVRSVLDIVLRQQGFAVWLTKDGYQAIKAYQGRRADIDVVLIDVRMPGLDGPETLAALQKLNPRLRCCFMTGDPGRYSEDELLQRGAERILYKPFRLEEMTRFLWDLVNEVHAEVADDSTPCPLNRELTEALMIFSGQT